MTGSDKRVKLILACPMTTGRSDPFRRSAVSAAHLGRHLFQMQMISRLLAALALTAALTLSTRAALWPTDSAGRRPYPSTYGRRLGSRRC